MKYNVVYTVYIICFQQDDDNKLQKKFKIKSKMITCLD